LLRRFTPRNDKRKILVYLGVVEFIPSNKTEIAQPVPSAAKNPALRNDK